jgi:hypothetical protein
MVQPPPTKWMISTVSPSRSAVAPYAARDPSRPEPERRHQVRDGGAGLEHARFVVDDHLHGFGATIATGRDDDNCGREPVTAGPVAVGVGNGTIERRPGVAGDRSARFPTILRREDA